MSPEFRFRTARTRAVAGWRWAPRRLSPVHGQGRHVLQVTLNANNHLEWLYRGKPFTSKTVVRVK